MGRQRNWAKPLNAFCDNAVRRRHLIMSIVFISLALTPILDIGPNIQHYYSSFLMKNSKSIYESAFKESIVHMDNVFITLIRSYNVDSIVASFIISCVSMSARTFREAGARVFQCSFVILMAIDVLNFSDSTQLIVNIVSNFVGAVAISAIFLTSLKVGNILFHGVRKNFIISGISCSMSGALFAIFLNFLIQLLYNPVPAHVEAVLDSPSGGIYFTPKDGTRWIDDDEQIIKENISFLSGQINSFNQMSDGAEFYINLYSKGADQKFDVSIEFFTGCILLDDQFKIKSTDPVLIRGVKSGSLKVDAGIVYSYAASLKSSVINLDIDSSNNFSFWKIERSKNNNIKTTEFFGDVDTKLYLSKISEPINVALTIPLIGGNMDDISILNRIITLEFDKNKYEINFIPGDRSLRSKNGDCRSIPATSSILKSSTYQSRDMGSIGIVLRVSPEVTTSYSQEDSLKIELTGRGGWMSAGYSESGFSAKKTGAIEAIGFSGNISNLIVDGANIPVGPFANNFAAGNMSGKFVDGGKLRILGKAAVFWKDGIRLNLTRWEHLRVEIQVGLLGIILTLTGLWMSWVYRVYMQDDEIGWIADAD